jgi:hypothetical protein
MKKMNRMDTEEGIERAAEQLMKDVQVYPT